MNTHKPLTVRVCGPLRSRINALAHPPAGQEETRIRAALIARVQAAAEDGAKLPELHSIVDRLEAGGGLKVWKIPKLETGLFLTRTKNPPFKCHSNSRPGGMAANL